MTTTLKVAAYLTLAGCQLLATAPGCLVAWDHFGPAVGTVLLALCGAGAARFAGWVVFGKDD